MPVGGFLLRCGQDMPTLASINPSRLALPACRRHFFALSTNQLLYFHLPMRKPVIHLICLCTDQIKRPVNGLQAAYGISQAF